jgi:hypothetical protein
VKDAVPHRDVDIPDDQPEGSFWTLPRIVEVGLALGAITAVITALW